MTTLVQSRQPLQVLSMNNPPPERRSGKRTRASIACDNDGFEFTFLRPKRARTTESEPDATPAPAPMPTPTAQSGKKKGRQSRTLKGPESNPAPAAATSPSATGAQPARRSARRKPEIRREEEEGEEEKEKEGEEEREKDKDGEPERVVAVPRKSKRARRGSEDNPAPDEPDELTAAPPPKSRSRSTKKQTSAAAASACPSKPPETAAKTVDEATKATAEKSVEKVAEKVPPKKGGRRAGKSKNGPTPPPPPPPPPPPAADDEPPRSSPDPEPEPVAMDVDPSPTRESRPDDPRFDVSPENLPTLITLPVSDTPIIARNKEMRKKAAAGAGTGGGRRSSLGSRGRRASSLMGSGHAALPHREVRSAEFFKHITGDGSLPEPHRMKALLTWCGERALSKKPPLGSPNAHILLGARAIEEQLLKDFKSRSELSDWFGRDELPQPAKRKEVVTQPNPKNIEFDQKIVELEAKVKRLREEKSAWQALKKPPPGPPPPLFSSSASSPNASVELPDAALLDREDAETFRFLTEPDVSATALLADSRSRLASVTSSLGFRVDRLADGVHKLEMRMATAGREADSVLTACAARLKQREEREKAGAKTRDLPVMEVLRSLGRILPPELDDSDGG